MIFVLVGAWAAVALFWPPMLTFFWLAAPIVGAVVWYRNGYTTRDIASWTLPLGGLLFFGMYTPPPIGLGVSVLGLCILAGMLFSTIVRRAWLRLIRSSDHNRATSSDRAAEERLLELEAQVGAALDAYAESGDHVGLRTAVQDVLAQVRNLECADPAWDTARLMMARWLDSLAVIAVAPHHQTDDAYEAMKERRRAFDKALVATGDVIPQPPAGEAD